MDYFKAGGVCLLFVLIAAALPIGGFAETPSDATASGTNSADTSASGASKTVSVSSGSQGFDSNSLGSTAAPIKVQRPRSGIRPTSVGAAASAVSMAPATSTSAASTSTASDSSQTQAQSQQSTKNAEVKTETVQDDAKKDESTNEITPALAQIIPPQVVKTQAVTDSTALAANASTSKNETLSTTASNETLANELKTDQTMANKTADNETLSTTENEPVPMPEFTDRIWRQGISPLDYTWTPLVFSGFYYDMDDRVGTENLTIHLDSEDDRAIDEHDLKYKTTAQPINFDFKEWGKYQVIGFMADKYFAGYSGTNVVDDISLINEGQLRKVLMDTNDEKTIVQGSVLPLEEGYELRIKEIDVDGNKVFLALAKDGEEIDSKVISPGNLKSSTYKYEVEIAGEDTPIIMAHIPTVFAGTESGVVTVDGLFQISDTYKSVEDGDEYGKMKVVSVSDAGVTMDNTDSITLGKGKKVEIFENVKFQVADAPELRFAPYVEHEGPYEIRGTIIYPSEAKEFTWTPYNFEGFYYDIDEDTGTEKLVAKITDGTSIEEGDLSYETSPSSVKFDFDDWGRYDVIGFMADKYFAGYNNNTRFTDEYSAISDGELRKILVDSSDEKTITTGSVLPLEEGYELRIKQVDINGNKVYLALAKDGKEIDSKVVSPSADIEGFRASNYLYKVDMGATDDVPLIAAHIQSVFKGTETDLATVDGLFQISDSPANVEEGEIQGKMKVETLSDTGISMQNEDPISLGRGRTVDIMGNLKFQVGDNEDRNFAPIAERSGATKALTLNVTEPIVVNKTMSILVRSNGEAISGVTVLVNGDVIGNTDAVGSISYVPKKVGALDLVAKKVPYADARENLVVVSSESAAATAASKSTESLASRLAISVPSEVLKNQTFLITVSGGANQSAIEDATVSFGQSIIGNTSSQGTLKYSSGILGEHIITAEKPGFDRASKNITVVTPIQVQGIELKSKTASTGKDVEITVYVKNIGGFNDSRNLELMVNGNKTKAAQPVTLAPGENKTVIIKYKPIEPGVYRLSLDGKEAAITAEKSKTNWALIALILVLLIAIGAGAYLYKSGELEGLKKRLQSK
jgi:S-layer protein (TIGR01567 family)